MRRILLPLVILGLVAAACGTATETGIQTVSAQDAYAITSAPPADLVVLDVRTPDEFNEGHLANAINIDFYAPDFSANLAALDKDVPYVLYCRSGSRSGTTAQEMQSLGFAEVYEVDGGIVSWLNSGLPLADS
ncbi:MAG: rhodanese-like domain-containing protein [Acidimicrobiia bacterium]|nr:rhodanese-like domain-containing protein [Acidimicrobiia bacterium]